MNEQLLARIKGCATLPSLPAIAVQVLELAQRDEADMGEIARVISKDPALTGKILRTVNSSFYGRAQTISTISQSLVILGLQSVKTLVLGFSLVSNLAKSKSKGFKHIDYWRHSMFGATAARVIAAKVGIVQQEEAFLAGLLADIGMLVLDQVLEEEYGQLLEGYKSHDDVSRLELASLEVSHAEVSGLLAEQWKLPPILRTPVTWHHNPEAVEDPALRKMTEVIRLASRCADVFVDADAAPAIADVRAFGKSVLGLESEVIDELLGQILTKTREIAPLFEINLGPTDTLENILKRANETLIQLTLQSQMQSHTLQEQNEKLKHQALTDRLTGLANRAAFEQESQRLWDQAQATGMPIVLLMIDLDKFKSINDTYGHPTGDETLRTVGKTLKMAARAQDLAARYGGEELVLLLPDTPREIGTVIAETVRRAIESKPIVNGDVQLKVTASIGVASWEKGSPLKTLAHIVKAADLGLYNAKHSGRNRVKVFNPRPQIAAA
ncbi:MAG: HDOD domain-containing protein [Burkholderiales bacterium]|nr:HDOD domain-containing protein [Phycisphaerae bacterium]